jgi:hypothetical protein
MNALSSHSSAAHLAEMVVIGAGFLQLVGAVIWITWLIKKYRQEIKRSREGLCMHCGYDLRHSKDKCPECGQTILRPK